MIFFSSASFKSRLVKTRNDLSFSIVLRYPKNQGQLSWMESLRKRNSALVVSLAMAVSRMSFPLLNNLHLEIGLKACLARMTSEAPSYPKNKLFDDACFEDISN